MIENFVSLSKQATSRMLITNVQFVTLIGKASIYFTIIFVNELFSIFFDTRVLYPFVLLYTGDFLTLFIVASKNDECWILL
jgi:hypothetical protein